MRVVAVPHEGVEPAHPADQAQARLFAEILLLELDEAESLGFNARINEVRRLLDSLQRRFSR